MQSNQELSPFWHKGVLHHLPKNKHVLCSLNIINTFLKNTIFASDSKLSKELKNSIKIKISQAVLDLLIQTTS